MQVVGRVIGNTRLRGAKDIDVFGLHGGQPGLRKSVVGSQPAHEFLSNDLSCSCCLPPPSSSDLQCAATTLPGPRGWGPGVRAQPPGNFKRPHVAFYVAVFAESAARFDLLNLLPCSWRVPRPLGPREDSIYI